ncbi:MAG: hypothetical protein ACOYO0_09345 [Sandarakinorhabdus sp.]
MSDWKILGFSLLVMAAGYGIFRFGDDAGNSSIKNFGGFMAISPIILLLALTVLGGLATVVGFIALPFLFIWKLIS